MTNPTNLDAAVDRMVNLIQTAITDAAIENTDSSQNDPAPTPTPAPAATANPFANLSLAEFMSLGGRPAPKVTMPEDPGFPTGLLPPHLEDWLTTMARLTSVPPAMVTIPFLAATGGVIGNRLALQLQAGWTEYPTLWVALVALTGARKTPALGAARLPFDLLHDELQTEWATIESSAPAVPLITPHASWEPLQQTLESSRGLILYRDELVGLLRAIDGHRGEDRQRYLSLWSADPIHQTGRPTIQHPVVSIIGGIQPLLMHRLRNRQPDGLLDRFIPILTGGKLHAFDRTLPRERPTVEPVLTTLRTIHRLPTTVVTLSPAAEDLWAIWHDAQVSLGRSTPWVIGGFYRKYPSQLARITLVLHALWHPHHPGRPIDRETMDRAITLIEHLRVHLHRSLFFINARHPVRSPAEILTDRILTALVAHAPRWLPHTHLARQLGRPPSIMLNTALIDLLTRNEIESRIHQPEGRGRPARQYRAVDPSRHRTNSHEIAQNAAEKAREINDSRINELMN